MGQVECKAPQVRCKSSAAAGGDDDGDEAVAVTDDPDVLLALVQRSWRSIPAVRTGPAPPPVDLSGSSPPDPGAMKDAVPQTFDEMAGFNAVILMGPKAPELRMLPAMFGAMPGLVEAVGDAARLGRACADLARQLSEQGVSLEEAGKFKAVLVASLRSLLPRSWNAQYEVAWGWFWARAVKGIGAHMGGRAALVQSSWAKIPTEAAPAQEGGVQIPHTFEEMMMFNMMVMAGTQGPDMGWSAAMFPAMPALVGKVASLEELDAECGAVGGRILAAGATEEAVREFEAASQASLRSLLPTDWDSDHEAAWRWFWSRVSPRLCKHLR